MSQGSRPKKHNKRPFFHNSLLISLLAGNCVQRRVRSRLFPPPPKRLIYQEFWFRRSRFEIGGHFRRFAGMPIGHASGETHFRAAILGETGRSSLLAIAVVE